MAPHQRIEHGDGEHRPREARAHGGPADGQQWPVTNPDPPAWVELPTGRSSVLYRLVREPGSREPVLDDLGNYLYVPIHGRADQPRVIDFRRDGRIPRRRKRPD